MVSLFECLRHCYNSHRTVFKYLWELINPTAAQDNHPLPPECVPDTLPCWTGDFLNWTLMYSYFNSPHETEGFTEPSLTTCASRDQRRAIWLPDLRFGTGKSSSLTRWRLLAARLQLTGKLFISHNDWLNLASLWARGQSYSLTLVALRQSRAATCPSLHRFAFPLLILGTLSALTLSN